MTIKYLHITAPQQGWNLLELLIVLSIVTILLGIAYPNYTQYLARSHRQQASAALLETASALEHYYAQHHTYQGASLNKLQLKSNIANDNYQLNIDNTSQTSFQISAIPQGQQVKIDKCGTLRLDHLGKQSTDNIHPSCHGA